MTGYMGLSTPDRHTRPPAASAMAQAATMGPPLSPREIRRSGRRSAPSASTSASKSPDADLPPRQKENPQRAPQPSSASSRSKRTKDDADDHPDDRKHSATAAHSSTSSSNSSNSKGKRKHKEKDKQRLSIDVAAELVQDPVDDKAADPAEEEEQGITRCVCGSNGDDEADAGEFMVQCETCKVWQHGLCMGYESEDQVHDADYYCELCRPELHAELLKKLAKKARQSSAVSHTAAASRLSRSHSPTHLKQPSKRRNTMNSRDAAFDESLKEIIEASAAEAAAAQESAAGEHPPSNISQLEPEDEPEIGSSSKRKRKRIDDDAPSKKRTRSASTASDHNSSSIPRPPTPPPKAVPSTNNTKPGGRAKRAARKNAPALDTPAPLDGDETTQPATATTTKRHGGNSRSKGTGTAKRSPISHSNSHGNNNMNHEQGSRRGQPHNANNQGGSTLESTRAYRNSHAYAVSQQPLFTSWGLPDYLAHLEEMLPTNTPQPLEIHSGVGSTGGGRESMERTMERGVKVKWPSKRMSVGDMNKRVRALVEWVGREQANALDRERRKDALERALKLESEILRRDLHGTNDKSATLIDGSASLSYSGQSKTAESEHEPSRIASSSLWKTDDGKPMSTMKMMEELMEELIGFQERFGPGAKTRERERRSLIAS